MELWNFVHNNVSKSLGIDIHVWEFLAAIVLVIVAIVALVHHVLRKRADRRQENRFDTMAAYSDRWEDLRNEGAPEEDAPHGEADSGEEEATDESAAGYFNPERDSKERRTFGL